MNALVFGSVAVFALALSIQLSVAVLSFYSLVSAAQGCTPTRFGAADDCQRYARWAGHAERRTRVSFCADRRTRVSIRGDRAALRAGLGFRQVRSWLEFDPAFMTAIVQDR